MHMAMLISIGDIQPIHYCHWMSAGNNLNQSRPATKMELKHMSHWKANARHYGISSQHNLQIVVAFSMGFAKITTSTLLSTFPESSCHYQDSKVLQLQQAHDREGLKQITTSARAIIKIYKVLQLQQAHEPFKTVREITNRRKHISRLPTIAPSSSGQTEINRLHNITKSVHVWWVAHTCTVTSFQKFPG